MVTTMPIFEKEIPVTLDESCRIAVVRWAEKDGIADAIHHELGQLGHCPIYFRSNGEIPTGVEVVFSFAPYGEFLPIVRQLANVPAPMRPVLVHWNTEGLPDLRLPWLFIRALGLCRSWLGRLAHNNSGAASTLAMKLIVAGEKRGLRFRYIGDYYYAYGKGLLDIFADSSAVYTRLHNRHGLPAIFAPWGVTQSWHADLNLERDIDVLWMGIRGTRRRSNLLDRVCGELRARGVRVHVADNRENPFIFDNERINFLNRSKITLNLARTWYDDNFSRFAMAMPNRSMVVSEPLLPHCPAYESGYHYVSAPIEALSETVLYYLRQEDERQRIVENAYQLVTSKLTFRNSMKTIMDAVNQLRRTTRRPANGAIS